MGYISTHFSPHQTELPFQDVPLLPAFAPLTGLDLFAGIGGLSAGFSAMGFAMVGVDSDAVASAVYENAGFGTSRQDDLSSTTIELDVLIVVGGPPCRPWSPVNLQRRKKAHGDHALFGRFIEHVHVIRPAMFVMENVPALRGDESYVGAIRDLRAGGYDIAAQVLHYDQFGAATKRRRLFTVGVRERPGGAGQFFTLLQAQHSAPSTVRHAIERFRDCERGAVPDHDWSQLESISNYRDRYASGQYGWKKLDYDSAAPSFGSVAKTYILHPEAGVGSFPERVLSVREAMAITGFSDEVRFPSRTPRAHRYQMVANAVSPSVSRAVAIVARHMLVGDSIGICDERVPEAHESIRVGSAGAKQG